MRFAVIACRVFNRELSSEIAQCPNLADLFWVEQELHNTPVVLSTEIQKNINTIDASAVEYDAILLLYGLCSNGVLGVFSSKYDIIIPKTDDCIGIFLGSQQRYLDIFHANKGTYWYIPGWYENGSLPSEDDFAKRHEFYSKEYGEDNADYLIETEMASLLRYSNCACINSTVFNPDGFFLFSKRASQFFKWRYNEFNGDTCLIKKLLSGDWDESFIRCSKHEKLKGWLNK